MRACKEAYPEDSCPITIGFSYMHAGNYTPGQMWPLVLYQAQRQCTYQDILANFPL